MRGGAFLNGKEGRVGFRKKTLSILIHPLIILLIFPRSNMIHPFLILEIAWYRYHRYPLFQPLPVIILKPVSQRFLETPLKLIAAVLQLLTTDIRRNLEFLYSRRTTCSVDFEILIKHIHTNETELYLNQTEASEKKENIFS